MSLGNCLSELQCWIVAGDKRFQRLKQVVFLK